MAVDLTWQVFVVIRKGDGQESDTLNRFYSYTSLALLKRKEHRRIVCKQCVSVSASL